MCDLRVGTSVVRLTFRRVLEALDSGLEVKVGVASRFTEGSDT